MPDSQRSYASFAPDTSPRYAVLLATFVGLLLISNIAATKLIEIGPIITDGGAVLFPLVYVIGDVISDVYGWPAMRRAIVVGFVMAALAAVTFLVVGWAPPAADYLHQEAFEAVLGFVPRIVLASLAGFAVGQTLNSVVLIWIKERTLERRLWLRLLASTVVGEFGDTLVFATIAFLGILQGANFWNYVFAGIAYKIAVEAAVLPITYRAIAHLKAREPEYLPVERPFTSTSA
ncbi:MAG: queuosine precursor transporter [Candidatus Nanopelagicales bacterium]